MFEKIGKYIIDNESQFSQEAIRERIDWTLWCENELCVCVCTQIIDRRMDRQIVGQICVRTYIDTHTYISHLYPLKATKSSDFSLAIDILAPSSWLLNTIFWWKELWLLGDLGDYKTRAGRCVMRLENLVVPEVKKVVSANEPTKQRNEDGSTSDGAWAKVNEQPDQVLLFKLNNISNHSNNENSPKTKATVQYSKLITIHWINNCICLETFLSELPAAQGLRLHGSLFSPMTGGSSEGWAELCEGGVFEVRHHFKQDFPSLRFKTSAENPTCSTGGILLSLCRPYKAKPCRTLEHTHTHT